MLLRCGGNVIEVGRQQLALVATATVILMMVSVYSVSMLHALRRGETDWVQPSPIDHVLQRVNRDHQHDSREPADQQDAVHRDRIRRKATKTNKGTYALGILRA